MKLLPVKFHCAVSDCAVRHSSYVVVNSGLLFGRFWLRPSAVAVINDVAVTVHYFQVDVRTFKERIVKTVLRIRGYYSRP